MDHDPSGPADHRGGFGRKPAQKSLDNQWPKWPYPLTGAWLFRLGESKELLMYYLTIT
jgi:hypothetical protein